MELDAAPDGAVVREPALPPPTREVDDRIPADLPEEDPPDALALVETTGEELPDPLPLDAPPPALLVRPPRSRD